MSSNNSTFSAIGVCLIVAIVSKLGGLTGGILIGVKLKIIITLATKVPLIGICVEFVTYGYLSIVYGFKIFV